MTTALVTGVAGFIGSHLAETLLERGYTVRGVDNLSTGRQANMAAFRENPSFTFHERDMRSLDATTDLVDGVDYVFHQAAVASVPKSVRNPVTTTEVNCTGTARLFDAARNEDVESVVVASSSAVYGSGGELPKVESMHESPESPYALSKYYTEKLAVQCSELYGIDTVALRYFNVFGPRQDPEGEYAAVIPKFISLMLEGKRPVIYGDGQQSRDFVYIDDVVEANIRAASSDATGLVANVASGQATTINELVEGINTLLGTSIEPRYGEPRPGDVRHSVADVDRAREQFGFDPQTGFSDGLDRTISWFQ